MFVWAGNAGRLLVNERGRVKDHNHVDIPPKYDSDGYKYVEYGRARYYVHELVIQNHGKPPHKNRLPKTGEVVVFVDGDTTNVGVDNLEYRQKSSDGTFRRPEGVPEAVEEYVWQLLKQGYTYSKIQQKVAESNYENRTISTSKIADIRRERSEQASQGAEHLSPAERQSLESIKRHLGETDDNKALRHKLAKQQAEAKSRKIQAEAAAQQAAEAAAKAAQPEDRYDAEHVGGGWWKIEHNGEELTEQRFRKADAKALVKEFRKGGKHGQELLRQLQKDKD